jgi:hypothetical protein
MIHIVYVCVCVCVCWQHMYAFYLCEMPQMKQTLPAVAINSSFYSCYLDN